MDGIRFQHRNTGLCGGVPGVGTHVASGNPFASRTSLSFHAIGQRSGSG